MLYENIEFTLKYLDTLFIIKFLLDISIISLIIFRFGKELNEMKKIQILKYSLIVGSLWFIGRELDLLIIKWFINIILEWSPLILIIIFQNEIRRMLSKPGLESKFRNRKKERELKKNFVIDAISDACQSMAKKGVGALIVIEGKDNLIEHSETGTPINADISTEIIENIFINKSPLHDGAMIISGYSINAASCFLPLIESEKSPKELGARHRAALGISEEADCLSIIISEETGEMSIAEGGVLIKNISSKELKLKISGHLGKGRKKRILDEQAIY